MLSRPVLFPLLVAWLFVMPLPKALAANDDPTTPVHQSTLVSSGTPSAGSDAGADHGTTPSTSPSWKQNMKVGVELGFGIPFGWMIMGIVAEHYRVHGYTIGKTYVSPNVRLGAMWSYGFPLFGNDFKLGPSVGLAYSMTQRFRVPRWGATVEERYLQIPVGITLSLPLQNDGIRQSLTWGYEFDILLSSSYKQSGGWRLPSASWEGNKDLTKAISDLSSVTGSIFFDAMTEFSRGFYLVSRIRFPVVELLAAIEKEERGEHFPEKLDSNFMHLVRVCSTSYLEITLGVNMAHWF